VAPRSSRPHRLVSALEPVRAPGTAHESSAAISARLGMALPRDMASGSTANASRLSLASDAPSRDSTDYSAANTTRNGITVPPELLQKSAAAQARYRMLSLPSLSLSLARSCGRDRCGSYEG
jgi:hypothetical protein